MDLHRVVGGLLTRDAVLGALLTSYAERLEPGWSPRGTGTSPCFVVPSWTVHQHPPTVGPHELFAVAAHTSPADPRRHENLDAVLRRVHTVLTGDEASRSITARRLRTTEGLVTGGLDTVSLVGTWELALAPSPAPWPARALPRPAGRVVTATGSPETARLN